MSDRYLIDRESEEARQRLRLLEALEDPGTILQLEATGVAPGWRCLEVGAGGGSIAAWLCRQTGPGGTVVAVDLDARFLRDLDPPNLEIREHDVVEKPLEERSFDLVHARSVLMHIRRREEALALLARAVRPGGWLVVEEPDAATDEPDPSSPAAGRKIYRRVIRAVYAFVQEHEVDPYFGAELGARLHSLGFELVEEQTRQHLFRGASEPRSAHMPALRELRDPIVSRGVVSAREYDDFLGLEEDPTFRWREAALISVRGRRPATGS
jgi:ubiquinone/menaquinone biosynthesis C-methylase UbiE